MKIDNSAGIWHAPWLTHYNGASTAELDLNEFFVYRDGQNKATQSIHLHDFKTDKLRTNLPYMGRGGHTFNVSNPEDEFHVTSVAIEPIHSIQTKKGLVAIINLLKTLKQMVVKTKCGTLFSLAESEVHKMLKLVFQQIHLQNPVSIISEFMYRLKNQM